MVEVIETDNVGKLFTNVAFLSDEGALSCVLTADYKKNRVGVKVVTYWEDAAREAQMGTLLKDNPFFLKIIAVVKTNEDIKDIKPIFSKFSDKCKEQVNGNVSFIVMEFLEKWKNLDKFTKDMSPEDVRAVMFDVVVALAYANSRVAYQHNDLKQGNIMCREIKPPKDVVYQLGSDVFVIPNKKYEVKIIDIGSGSVFELFNSDIFTRNYLPLDILPDNDEEDPSNKDLIERTFYHDYAAIAVMMIELLTQQPIKNLKEFDLSKSTFDTLTNLVLQRLISQGEIERLIFCETPAKFKKTDLQTFGYGFANAIYHPYFAFFYWKKAVVPEEALKFEEPGQYRTDITSVSKKLETIQKKLPVTDNDIVRDNVRKIVNTLYINYDKDWKNVSSAEAKKFLDQYWSKLLEVLQRHEELTRVNIFKDEELLPRRVETTKKKNKVTYKITYVVGFAGENLGSTEVKLEGFKEGIVIPLKRKGAYFDGEDFRVKVAPSLVYFTVFMKLLNGEDIDGKIPEFQQAYDALQNPKQGITQTEFSQLVRDTLSSLNSAYTFDPIKAAMLLESLERNNDYLIADGVFDFDKIRTELYEPIVSASQQHIELTNIREHLQFDKELHEHWSNDFTQQTKYLHTLSVVADMIGKASFPLEQQERCYVEWQDRRGQTINI